MNSEDLKRIVTATLVCLLVLLGWQWVANKHRPAPSPATPTEQTEPGSLANRSAGDSAARVTASVEKPQEAVVAQGRWYVRTPETQAADVILGNRQKDGGYKAEIRLNGMSASVSQVFLSEYKWHVDDEETGYPLLNPHGTDKTLESFQLGQLKFEGRSESFDLSDGCWRSDGVVTRSDGTEQVDFAAEIIDSANQLIFRIIKRFEYGRDDYTARVSLLLENHNSAALSIGGLEMMGPVGMFREDPRADRRTVAVGYQRGAADFETKRVLASKFDAEHSLLSVDVVNDKELAWYALANKFFAAIVQPTPAAQDSTALTIKNNTVQALNLLKPYSKKANIIPAVFTKLRSEEAIAPQSSGHYGLDVYLGPLDKGIFDAAYPGRNYEKLVPVTWCAFEWLTFGLLALLKGLYAIIGNYGIAIMLFVLLVRLILHPVTKKSQVNMMKMSKMGPQVEEIKKKYANNPTEMQKKIAELYREQGAGAFLGCLPMFLQMPIWFALYTAVDTNVAMRHQGLFPPSWHWITDLTAPDRLVPLEWFNISAFHVPLVGPIDAFNLLPFLLFFAMILQMKLNPQMQMAQANPQQAAQQKMMMWMMPIMLLVFLYTAPSGLNLYIMASTFGGVIEQYYIRKHIREQQALEEQGVVTATRKITTKLEPKKRKPRPPQKYI